MKAQIVYVRDEFIFVDKVSGARTIRLDLDACLDVLEPRNTLLVWRLDRLGRSMPHPLTLIQELLEKGIAFRSLRDGAIDTTSANIGEMSDSSIQPGYARVYWHAKPGRTRRDPAARRRELQQQHRSRCSPPRSRHRFGSNPGCGLSGVDDPSVLEWAAEHRRILLTHDVATITAFAYERIRAGKSMPGVFELGLTVALRSAIEDIVLLATCSVDGEWECQVRFFWCVEPDAKL